MAYPVYFVILCNGPIVRSSILSSPTFLQISTLSGSGISPEWFWRWGRNLYVSWLCSLLSSGFGLANLRSSLPGARRTTAGFSPDIRRISGRYPEKFRISYFTAPVSTSLYWFCRFVARGSPPLLIQRFVVQLLFCPHLVWGWFSNPLFWSFNLWFGPPPRHFTNNCSWLLWVVMLICVSQDLLVSINLPYDLLR